MTPGRGWKRYQRRRVIVNTIAGDAFDGILWDGRGPLVLRGARLVGDAGRRVESPATIDGEVIIDFARVAWVQAPPEA